MALEAQNWSHACHVIGSDRTAVASTASEASILAPTGEQPYIPATHFDGVQKRGRAFRWRLSGVFSTTGTPTLIFQFRSSTTVGVTTLSGASLGVTAAITTGNGVSAVNWWAELFIECRTPGQGTNLTTLSCHGQVFSPTGFASPFYYPVTVTTPPTATWTATIDNTLTQFLNASITWSASSASNTLTCKSSILESLN